MPGGLSGSWGNLRAFRAMSAFPPSRVSATLYEVVFRVLLMARSGLGWWYGGIRGSAGVGVGTLACPFYFPLMDATPPNDNTGPRDSFLICVDHGAGQWHQTLSSLTPLTPSACILLLRKDPLHAEDDFHDSTPPQTGRETINQSRLPSRCDTNARLMSALLRCSRRPAASDLGARTIFFPPLSIALFTLENFWLAHVSAR